MKTLLFTTLALVISSFFLAPTVSEAKVLFEQSKVGTPYDIFEGAGDYTDLRHRLPQYSGTLPVLNASGTISYRGTAEWVRLKRISGVECDTRVQLTLIESDGVTRIGDDVLFGIPNGEFCDFRVTGPNRTDGKIGIILICYNGRCGFPDSFVLDGSSENDGYVSDGYFNAPQPGGWAFQICDIDGCEGGFGSVATSTPTTTPTTTPPTATSTGASSVLFLPGIQASRLYVKEEGDENRLWEPNINADVEKLALDENGVSVNQIYTRDVVDEIFGVSNIYRTFINQMNNLKNNEKIIKDISIFSYDWRFSVEDVVADGVQYENEIKNLVAEVESLASSSFTDKVTIIAHSNGGLVGKSLISELERLGKTALIDKLVMVGTPQLGTPKAIGVLLHGLDQQVAGGLVVNDVTAREVIKNMPGAYSLLPSSKYFEKSSGPIVVADNSNSTAVIRTYGPIESASSLKNFLLDNSNTRDVNTSRINQPSVLNPVIFAKHEQLQSRLDNWQAPAGVAVYEVVGTGIGTIRGIEYRAFPCVAVICAFGFQMKPYPLFSDEGDETVMALSAGGYDGDKVTAKVDLVREGAQFTVRERKHANLIESPTVQDFIDAVIRFPYINETAVVPPDFVEVSRKYTVIGVHSPVVLSVVDAEGRKVGRAGNVVNEDMPGSQFVELGGSSYILVPADSNYTASIEGTGAGVYSLTIDSLEGDNQTNEFLYIGASTSPTMKATFTASSSGFSTIKTDSNGDGQIDLEQNLNGEIVVPDIVYKYSDLHNAVINLPIPRIAKQVVLLQVTLAERLSILAGKQPRQRPLELKILKGIEDTIQIMEKKKIVASIDANQLYVIINYLEQ